MIAGTFCCFPVGEMYGGYVTVGSRLAGDVMGDFFSLSSIVARVLQYSSTVKTREMHYIRHPFNIPIPR